MKQIRKAYFQLRLYGRIPSYWSKDWENIDNDEFGAIEYCVSNLPAPRTKEEIEIILNFLPERGDPLLGKIEYLVSMLQKSPNWNEFASNNDILSYGEANEWIHYLVSQPQQDDLSLSEYAFISKENYYD